MPRHILTVMIALLGVSAQAQDPAPPMARPADTRVLEDADAPREHGARRPKDEVSPEEKAAQYLRIWLAVGAAVGGAGFGLVMRRRMQQDT